MYALVEIAGEQFKVEQGNEIFVNRLKGKEGDKLEFSDVLLIDDEGGKVLVGTPNVPEAKITASIIDHLKGDKVIVFKKKRRKGYKVKKGHRDYLTKIKIESINAKGVKAIASPKKETAKPAPKKATPKAESTTQTKVPDKKAPIKKETKTKK